MSLQAQNAQNLYLHAIQDGCVAEAQASSVGDTYIQHSTGVPDGKEGFAAFFADFFKRHPEREIKIVRTKHIDLKPMTAEEACLQMELLGHSFFVFQDGNTGKVNVVYKRKANSYGLIEPEE